MFGKLLGILGMRFMADRKMLQVICASKVLGSSELGAQSPRVQALS